MLKRILLTGAAGKLGRVLREGLRGVWPVLRLSHRRLMGESRGGEEIYIANLENYAEVEASMQDVDAVVHLGGMADEAEWETIRQSNIEGTYNVFEAARSQGVKRMVFASSNHVIGFYRRNKTLYGAEPPRPDTLYGVSKAFSEALGRYYADKFGLSVINLRIGTCSEYPLNRRMLSTWLSHRDFVQLVRLSVEAKDVHYATLWGVSNNDRTWWDNRAAFDLGYRPQDNSEQYLAQAVEEERKSRTQGQPSIGVPPGPETDVEKTFQGGHYSAIDFDGDITLID